MFNDTGSELFFTHDRRFLLRQKKTTISIFDTTKFLFVCQLDGNVIGISKDNGKLLTRHPDSTFYAYDLEGQNFLKTTQCRPDDFDFYESAIVRENEFSKSNNWYFWTEDIFYKDAKHKTKSINLLSPYYLSPERFLQKIVFSPYVLASVKLPNDRSHTEIGCYDIQLGKHICQIPTVSLGFLTYSFIRTKRLGLAQFDNLRIIDLRTGVTPINTHVNGIRAIVSIALHPTIEPLVGVITQKQGDSQIHLLNVTQKKYNQLNGQEFAEDILVIDVEEDVDGVIFSPDGKLLIASTSNELILFELFSGRRI